MGMINTEETIKEFGYDPTIMAKGSHKNIMVNCGYCNRLFETTMKIFSTAIRKTEDINFSKTSCKSCRQLKAIEVAELRGRDWRKARDDGNARGASSRALQADTISKKCKETWANKEEQEIESIINKRKSTCLEKYGVDSPFHVEETKQKIKNTMLERYGVENASNVKEFCEKRQNTMVERYGVRNAGQNHDIKEKIRATNEERYGGLFVNLPDSKKKTKLLNQARMPEIVEKRKITCLEKYGYENPNSSPEQKQKNRDLRVARENVRMVGDQTIKELSLSTGRAVSYLNYIFRNGSDMSDLSREYTNIEREIKLMIPEACSFTSHQEIAGCRTDFLISNKVVIEADGLFWHSEANNKPKRYHENKMIKYLNAGYTPLFFRSDEILYKKDIVKSIISNKLGFSKRIGARKCEIVKLNPDIARQWIESHHLMGYGRGDTLALTYNGDIVAALQIVKRNDKESLYEVSRFCTESGVSVVGGFTKLISAIIKQYNPKKIMTYIDLRYGSGAYLPKIGFEYKGEYLSFRWTDGKKTFHRLKFPANTGYDHNLFKIWDCGQAKYVLDLPPSQ